MLQYQTVSPELLLVLRNLSEIKDFSSLRLVGGTALALQIGHRTSVDIDLFGSIDFQQENYIDFFHEIGRITEIKKSKNINIYAINDIKVDIVNYNYPWLVEPVLADGLQLAAIEDIAAMKLNAIGRGSKKDFIDLYYILKRFSLDNIFQFYSKKYHDGNLFLVKKSLLYFVDADTELTPKLFQDITWNEIKFSLLDSFKAYGL